MRLQRAEAFFAKQAVELPVTMDNKRMSLKREIYLRESYSKVESLLDIAASWDNQVKKTKDK